MIKNYYSSLGTKSARRLRSRAFCPDTSGNTEASKSASAGSLAPQPDYTPVLGQLLSTAQNLGLAYLARKRPAGPTPKGLAAARDELGTP